MKFKPFNQKISMICRLFSDIPSLSKFITRSHTCGELRTTHVGQKVQLCGWLEFQRMDKFAIIRDAYGSVQVIIPEEKHDLIAKLKDSSLESVVKIEGEVIKRPETQVNKDILTGEIEVVASDYKILNNVTKQLPFSIRDHNKPKENVRMKYRYLDLRYPEMQRNLRLRSDIIFKMREYLVKEGFVEVETPTLFKRTPGGAQEYVVPTETAGAFYALVQSPQQLKQLLMVGGLDKYFQVARCYRNEGARPDRQPEFSQLDIELSFTNQENVMSLMEQIITHSWPEKSVGPLPSPPFMRMSYSDAFNLYGTDKPDLSSSVKIQSLNKSVWKESNPSFSTRLLLFPNTAKLLTNSLKKQLNDIKTLYPATRLYFIKVSGDSENIKMDVLKTKLSIDSELLVREHKLNEGDLLIMASGEKYTHVTELLGKIRTEVLDNQIREVNTKWNFLWLNDFPLFEEMEGGRLKAMHHPFTQPHSDDIHFLNSDPLKVRGLHYDLVLNGWEIAGGSVRIHSAQLQRYILSDLLGISPSSLEHILDALDSGAPPHAGIALGLDRYVSLLVGAPSIRDVIAFPKTTGGRDAMCGSPCRITEKELELYNISVRENEESQDTLLRNIEA